LPDILHDELMCDRLKRARRAAGFRSATAAIERFGWKASTYRAHENGQNNFSADHSRLYAQAFGVSASWLLLGEADVTEAAPSRHDTAFAKEAAEAPAGAVTLRGKVATGVWIEAASADEAQEPGPHCTLPPSMDHPPLAQFDLIVADASFNKHANIGDVIRCVDVKASGASVQDGDLIVLERNQSGLLKETSARRIRISEAGYEFWSESHDPRWRNPIIADGAAVRAGKAVKIIGKIIFIYRRMDQRL